MNTAPPLAGTAPDSAPRRLVLRTLLVIVALREAVGGLSSAILFRNMSEIPGAWLGGAIIKAYIASHPVLALAALIFAAIGNVRYAVIALGALVIMTWLNYMPLVLLHGLDFHGGAYVTSTQVIAFPLLGTGAIALAARHAARTRSRAGQHTYVS
jgi:hypothetical protein